MANVNVTSDAWTEISITSGTIQNISATADIELSAEQTDNSGVVLKPSELYQWDNETIYARAVTEETGALRVVNFKRATGGGGGYVLPVATASTLGGVKVGNNLIIDADTGVLSATGGGNPVGTIISFMGTSAPTDYLICDGTAYNITDYQTLADHITAQFGAVDYFGGDGVSTFAVPDLRGEFLRGTGTNSHTGTGSGNGANIGVHQDPTLITYMGDETADSEQKIYWSWISGWDTGTNQQLYKNADGLVSPQDVDNTSTVRSVQIKNTYTQVSTYGDESKSWGVAMATRPTNTSVLYCIKYNTSVLSTPENNYSTEEQRIGTWIDGKSLYQKTYEITSPSTAGAAGSVIALDATVDIVDMQGHLLPCLPINFTFDTTNYVSTWQNGGDDDIYMKVSSHYVNNAGYITLQYTKSSD